MCPQSLKHKIHSFAAESVPDPWYTGDFEETYDRVLTGCRDWLARLENEINDGKY
jgi:low molecular weight phosphotyrosine protein phosphatase